MAFSSRRLPKVIFGRLSNLRQIVIWHNFGRAVHGPPRSLSKDYSDRLLAQAQGAPALEDQKRHHIGDGGVVDH